MTSTVEWLESIGLGEYAQRFAENAIDLSILRDLTDQDLKELGVLLGHRRKMLRAIAGLGAAAIAPAGSATQTKTESLDEAERRHLTVMFCDLVGSAALSTRLDPEDLREIISAYQKRVAEGVSRFGGFVAQYLGDGVLVYFGYPEAHEDDAERAVRAGLELIEAIIALKTPASLQTRVGIATGLVVVGDLMTGSGEVHERGIVGETPNLAARLQGIAEPNTVVIAEATRRLLGNLFELKDLGAREGVAEPVRLGGVAGEQCRKPLRGPASERSDCPRRARGRNRAAVAALVAGEEPRGSGSADFWRSGHRQIAAHSRSSGKPCS
jgi:class 3 adenylate cyclase